MTKLYKTDAEIRRERADGEIRAAFERLQRDYPDVRGMNRYIRTISEERSRAKAPIASPRGVLLSLQRTHTI